MSKNRDQEPQTYQRNQSMNDRRQAIVEEIPRLRRYARMLLTDSDAADDLVEHSLERALSRMQSWTSGDSLRRGLFKIMHHLVVDQSRRTDRHVHALTAMPVDEVASVEMLSALQQIDLERSAALVLVAVEGLSYTDAANVLGISTSMLVSRIAAGWEELRSILDDFSRRKAIKVVQK